MSVLVLVLVSCRRCKLHYKYRMKDRSVLKATRPVNWTVVAFWTSREQFSKTCLKTVPSTLQVLQTKSMSESSS